MKWPYHFTFLNIASAFYMAGIAGYTAFNYSRLAAQEGWGVIAMLGLVGIGAAALLADFLVQLFIRNKKRQNKIGFCIALLIAIALMTL